MAFSEIKFEHVKHGCCFRSTIFWQSIWLRIWCEFTKHSTFLLIIIIKKQCLLHFISDKQSSFADNFKAFTQTVLATRRSPSTETKASFLFSTDQIKAITDYFKTRSHPSFNYIPPKYLWLCSSACLIVEYIFNSSHVINRCKMMLCY